jgi:hypothetical protein
MRKVKGLGIGFVVLLLCLLSAGEGKCGVKVETAHLIVDDVQQQLSAVKLEKFAADAETAFAKTAAFWAVPYRKGGKIILELHKEHAGRAFAVFQIESTREGKRSFVRLYGVTNPQEMVHKLTHALFPTEDKLIRNMIGIPTEARFGNPRSFPMCGYDVDAWSAAIRRSGSYIPLKELGENHEDWGMTFKGKTPTVSDRKRQHASYAEAGSFGTFLLDRYGVGKVKAFFRASKDEKRPWKEIFGRDLRELEAEWLQSLETQGKVSAERIDFLEGLWKKNPKTACDRAEATAK